MNSMIAPRIKIKTSTLRCTSGSIPHFNDSNLEDSINATSSKVAECVTRKLNLLHFEVDSTIEVKLAAVDSAASSKLNTKILTATLLSPIDTKVNEIMQHEFEIQLQSIVNDLDSKAASGSNTTSKDCSKGLEVFNSNLITVS